MTMGDCVVADFSTKIDTHNLSKYNLIKKFNSSHNNNTQLLQMSSTIDDQTTTEQIHSSKLLSNDASSSNEQTTKLYNNNSTSSGKTQFYSPINETNSNTNLSNKCSLVGNINNGEEVCQYEYENTDNGNYTKNQNSDLLLPGS
jgi:hypothetical protein